MRISHQSALSTLGILHRPTPFLPLEDAIISLLCNTALFIKLMKVNQSTIIFFFVMRPPSELYLAVTE